MGNSQNLRCPNCRSENYTYEGKEDKWICDECGDEE